MGFEEIISRFNDPKKLADGSVMCRCPNHNDLQRSLHISLSRRNLKTLICCQAGCKTEDVLSRVNLTFADLEEEPKQKIKHNVLDRLAYGLSNTCKQSCKCEAEYRYTDAEGKYLYSRLRFSPKAFRYAIINHETDEGHFSRAENLPFTMYNLPQTLEAIKKGISVCFVEGEKDAENLRKIGIVATTCGSAKGWKPEFAVLFKGAKVVILPDFDEPGKALTSQIVRDIKPFVHAYKIVLTGQSKKGADVSDYLTVEKHNADDLKQLIENTEWTFAPWIIPKNSGISVNADRLAQNFLTVTPHLLQRNPADDKDVFLMYRDGIYRRLNRNAIKGAVREFLPCGAASDNLLNNVYGLILSSVAPKNICTFSDLDSDADIIAVSNGIYRISTKQLEPFDMRHRITRTLNCAYHTQNVSAPVFEGFINDMATSVDGEIDHEKIRVIQEFGGLVLSNIPGYRTKKALLLLSFLGNTGKTVLLLLWAYLLGERNIVNIALQDMNESSKFSVGSALGARLICVGDQTTSEVKDSALFKELTGGDLVRFEQKNRQPVYERFNGVITIAANNLPAVVDDKGGHLFERFLILPLENSISEEKRDSMLFEKMKPEADAIFLWFLQGLHRLIDNGYKFSPCAAAAAATKEYRNRLDTVFRFVTEKYVLTGNRKDKIGKSDFDRDYIDYCNTNDYSPVNKQNIKYRMAALGCSCVKSNIDNQRGVFVYCGIRERSPFENEDSGIDFQ